MGNKVIINETQMGALVDRLSKAIISAHKADLTAVNFVGVLTNGYPLALRIAKAIKTQTGTTINVGKLDVSLYRDDILDKGNFLTVKESSIPFEITDKITIIVDDVFFHGRTIRAAMDGIMDFGRPGRMELAVLIDRGYRELPIEPTYVGEIVKTQKDDYLNVKLCEVEAEDSVTLQKVKK
jgi:pyrimidine operon attenuation protein / uracil phosphoribosyltransferase